MSWPDHPVSWPDPTRATPSPSSTPCCTLGFIPSTELDLERDHPGSAARHKQKPALCSFLPGRKVVHHGKTAHQSSPPDVLAAYTAADVQEMDRAGSRGISWFHGHNAKRASGRPLAAHIPPKRRQTHPSPNEYAPTRPRLQMGHFWPSVAIRGLRGFAGCILGY